MSIWTLLLMFLSIKVLISIIDFFPFLNFIKNFYQSIDLPNSMIFSLFVIILILLNVYVSALFIGILENLTYYLILPLISASIPLAHLLRASLHIPTQAMSAVINKHSDFIVIASLSPIVPIFINFRPLINCLNKYI